MTDKQKITLIYGVVALVALLVFGMASFLMWLKGQREQPLARDVGKEVVEEIATLSRDIELEKQDGSSVQLWDLENHVWIAAQFYATCPMCAERNAASLLKVYNEFRSDPNFKVVCLSVDPEHDKSEHLKALQEQLGADGDNWWFVKAEKDEIWNYMRHVMLFTDIRERTVPEEIAAKGRWAHDLGLQIYRGKTMVGRWDEGRSYEALKKEVEDALATLKAQASL